MAYHSWIERQENDTRKNTFFHFLRPLQNSVNFHILDKPDKQKKQRIGFSSPFFFFFFLMINNPALSNPTYNLNQELLLENWSADQKACGRGLPPRNARNKTSDLSGWENGASWDAPLMVAKERMLPYTCVHPPTWKPPKTSLAEPQNDNTYKISNFRPYCRL